MDKYYLNRIYFKFKSIVFYFYEAFESLAELIYPEKNTCFICGIYSDDINDKYICDECLKKFKKIEHPICQICGKSLKAEPEFEICHECMRSSNYFIKSQSLFRYEGIAKKAIHDFKYHNKPYYYKLFANLLIEYMINNNYTDFDYILCVPLHKVKLSKRGYNQSKLIAKEVAKKLNIPFCDPLKRTKNTIKQSDLSMKERKNNLKNVFSIKNTKKNINFLEQLRGKRVLIIDDIFTTGTTINECSKVLIAYGIDKIYGLTLAR